MLTYAQVCCAFRYCAMHKTKLIISDFRGGVVSCFPQEQHNKQPGIENNTRLFVVSVSLYLFGFFVFMFATIYNDGSNQTQATYYAHTTCEYQHRSILAIIGQERRDKMCGDK